MYKVEKLKFINKTFENNKLSTIIMFFVVSPRNWN